MPARVEQNLLSLVIERQQFQALVHNKITEEYFFDAQAKDLFTFLRDYHRHYNGTPDFDNMQHYRPQFPYQRGIMDSIDGMCEQVRQVKIRVDMLNLSEELRAAADANPRAALDKMREASITMANEHVISKDMLASEAAQVLADRYQLSKASGGIIGIPWPWPCLSVETRGIQNGHFILIYGRPKHGKTWTAVFAAAHALVYAKARVLFYSMEMQTDEILERIVCAMASVDYDALYKGLLDTQDPVAFQRVQQAQDWLRQTRDYAKFNNDPYITDLLATCDSEEGGGGITSLRAKIREFRPNLVVVDGIYLMKDDRGGPRSAKWDAMTNISRDLKKTAQMFDVPIIGVTQGNRLADKDHKNADLREIGYADAPGQDADLILRIDKKKNADTHETELYITIVGFRHGSGKLDAFSIHFNPCSDFSFHNIITHDDPAQQPAKTTPTPNSGRSVPTFGPSLYQGPGSRR